LLLVGAPEPARNELSAALAETPENAGIDRARRRRKLARTLEREHRHVEALDAYALATLELGDAPPGPELEATWWFERIQIEADRAQDLYFLSRVDELQELVERMRDAIEVRGHPGQRLQFYQAVAHMQMRRDRYVVSDEAMENARAYLAAAEQVNDIRELAVARFFCAFCHMHRGTAVEAEPLFLAALKGAERAGDPLLTTRFLAYYSVYLRRLHRTAETREASLRTRSLAERSSATDYIGVSCGNLSFTAWCEGSWVEAEALGREAVAAWDKLLPGYVYPIQWIARMPLAATLLELDRTDDAVEQWQVLLRPEQAELPVTLQTAIEQAARADQGSQERRLRALEVRDLCRKYRYV
jgi:hypothetical protein